MRERSQAAQTTFGGITNPRNPVPLRTVLPLTADSVAPSVPGLVADRALCLVRFSVASWAWLGRHGEF